MSQVLFGSFHTVDHIPTKGSLSIKKVPVEKEINNIRRKLNMVGTYSTVEKRTKRMPDATVETTHAIVS